MDQLFFLQKAELLRKNGAKFIQSGVLLNSMYLFIYLLFLWVGKRRVTVKIPKTLYIHTLNTFHNVSQELPTPNDKKQHSVQFFVVFKRKSMVMIYDLWKWQNYVCSFSKMFNHIEFWMECVRLNSCLHWMAPSKWHWGLGWINGMRQNANTWRQSRPRRRRRRRKKKFRTCCFIASKSQIDIKTETLFLSIANVYC